jgi:Tat protein translocase TatB subunit
MDILGVGFSELIFILLIALMVFGPRRLPEIAAKAGKTVRDLRGMYQGLLLEWQREITVAARLEELEEARKELVEVKQELDQVHQDVKAKAQKDLNQVQKNIKETQENIKEAQENIQENIKETQENIAAELAIEQRTISPKPNLEQKPVQTSEVEETEPGSHHPQETTTSERAQKETSTSEAFSELKPETEIDKSNNIASSPASTNSKGSASLNSSPPVIAAKPEEILNE